MDSTGSDCWEGGDLPLEELRRMLALSMAPGVGPATFHRLIEAFGSADSVYTASAPELTAALPGLKADSLEAILKGPNARAIRFQEESCRRLHVRIVSNRSEAYPELLRSLPHPPPFLFIGGAWLPEDRKAMAVVGTRTPSPYGIRMVREMTLGLSEQGFTIVSGLARGIDTLAHDAALKSGARTLAVLGAGLDWIYPPENGNLAQRIARHGALITEFPIGVAPHATHFPRRNRLISALSLGTLVVEAGNDSGALITADYALDQGREVFAVPGAVRDPGTRGTHRLIREGAHLVENASDIVDVLSGTSQAAPSRRFVPASAASPASPIYRGGTPDPASPKSVPALETMGGAARVEVLAALSGPGPAPEAYSGRSREPAATGAIPMAERPGSAGAAVVPQRGHASRRDGCKPALDASARALLAVLDGEAKSLDAIAEAARRTPEWGQAKPHRLLCGLLELEIQGRVRRLPGAFFSLPG